MQVNQKVAGMFGVEIKIVEAAWRVLRKPLVNCAQYFRQHFTLWLRAEVAFAVQAHAHVAGFQVAAADDEHGVDFRLLGFGNLRLDRVGA